MLYTSTDNKKIKEIKKLNQKKYRDISNTFLIESEHLIEEAYKNGYLLELLLEENSNYKLDVKTSYLSKNVIKYITELETPTNILGICSKIKEKEIGNKVLILDEIRDPGNLGTIIRSAVAFNIDTVVLGENAVDLYNSKVVRASEGMLFNINIVKRDIKTLIEELKNKDYKILGTKVNGGKSLKSIEKSEKICIIMGNEGKGVNEDILSLCDEYIYIDMSKRCESLNVGVATSIILYELSR